MEPQTSAHDYDLFLTRIREIAAHRGFAARSLGTPFEDPLLRLTLLESAPDALLAHAAVEFLPAVNHGGSATTPAGTAGARIPMTGTVPHWGGASRWRAASS